MSQLSNLDNQTRLSVIMFSDIVGYSKMMQQNETLGMELLDRHNQIIRNTIGKHEGKEVKVIGDAFLVSFSSVANAVRCAIEIQEQFGKYNESISEKEKILLRIGIHMGDIILKDNDVFGDGVNIASRIEPLAEPGGICISQEVYNLVRHKLDLQVVSLGPKELKNIKDKIEIYEILVGSLSTTTHKAAKRKSYRNKWKYLSALAFFSIIGLMVIVFLLNKSSSDSLYSRRLNVGTNHVTSMDISSDGNWIVYHAVEGNKGANLFIVPATGGPSKKITNDTIGPWKMSARFSPAANEIVYQLQEDIYIVPTLGGTPRKLCSGGYSPVWSPDGKTILFFRHNDQPEKTGFYSINADGTNERNLTGFREVFRASTAWSPNGLRFAYLKEFIDTLDQRFSEIVIYNIAENTEKQITFDKKIINDLCWASTGKIIYSSNRNGDFDLWTIPESGGTPQSVTIGAGDDGDPRISHNGERLAFLNISQSLNLWTLDLQTQRFEQITFNEGQDYINAAISPDGNKVLYQFEDNSTKSKAVYIVCNIDGSEPITIDPKTEKYTIARYGAFWSPDNESFFFNGVREPTESGFEDSASAPYKVFRYFFGTNDTKEITAGVLADVSRDGILFLLKRDYFESDTALVVPASTPDSIIRVINADRSRWMSTRFTWDSKNIVLQDTNGIEVIPIDRGMRKMIPGSQKNFYLVDVAPNNNSIIAITIEPKTKRAVLVEMNYFSGKYSLLTALPANTQLSNYSSFFSTDVISPNGKMMIFYILEIKNRIILFDNFH